MTLHEQSKDRVAILANRDEAQHLLASLLRHDAELGAAGRRLQDALRGAGIEPWREPPHRRYEY